MPEGAKCLGLPMAYVSLAVLACQNSAVALLMRFSRSDPAERQYLSSTAVRHKLCQTDFAIIVQWCLFSQVLSSEVVKLVVALYLLQKVGN